MTMWSTEWMILYVVVLIVGYIAIFAFLERHNRRKKNGTQFDKPGHEQQIKSEANRPSN